MPRKPIPIDLDELEKLAAMHCTQEECAAWFDTTQKTMSLKLAHEPYKSVWTKGWAKGNISLRRQQKQRADAGDKTMLIWLGKQWLGQTDVQRNEITGKDGGPVRHEYHDFSALTDEELEQAIIREAESITDRASEAAQPLDSAPADAEAGGVSLPD